MAHNLPELLRAEIAQNGAISVAQFMSLCLGHPQFGYYMTRDPFGQQGDFTTAPEISAMFGEILGGLLVHAWEQAGSPATFTLLECGAGRGTLMADILRVAKRRPAFTQAMQLYLLETSPVLQQSQSKMLADFPHTHIATLADLPTNTPLLMVANEFFDALPIQQFVREKGEWFERVITLENDQFAFALRPTDKRPEPRDFVEVSPLSQAIWDDICHIIADNGGMAVVVDYGYVQAGKGADTLQAVKDHRYVDVLHDVGHADLTAHVDFASLHEIACKHGLDTPPVVGQGLFLKSLGIEARAQQLMAAHPDKAQRFADELKRLTAPDQMGDLFKVLVASRHVALG